MPHRIRTASPKPTSSGCSEDGARERFFAIGCGDGRESASLRFSPSKMGANYTIAQSTTTSPVSPATYSRAQKRVLDQAESAFRDTITRKAQVHVMGGIILSAWLLLHPRLRWWTLPVIAATAASFVIWGSVFTASKAATPDVEHTIWICFMPFVWVRYTAADGPPALPAVRSPVFRWWGRW